MERFLAVFCWHRNFNTMFIDNSSRSSNSHGIVNISRLQIKKPNVTQISIICDLYADFYTAAPVCLGYILHDSNHSMTSNRDTHHNCLNKQITFLIS